jgi:hypothetical protein
MLKSMRIQKKVVRSKRYNLPQYAFSMPLCGTVLLKQTLSKMKPTSTESRDLSMVPAASRQFKRPYWCNAEWHMRLC